jgi:hypothetical protein
MELRFTLVFIPETVTACLAFFDAIIKTGAKPEDRIEWR